MDARILVVDDHHVVRDAVRDALSTAFPCCLFWTATTGEEAIHKAASFHPDVVLMDVGLPGIDGIEATRRIKAIRPGTKVIVWTLDDEAALHAEVATSTAEAFLKKDGDPDDLLRTLRDLLTPDPVVHDKKAPRQQQARRGA